MQNPFIENRVSILAYLIVWALLTLNHIIVLVFMVKLDSTTAFYEAITYNISFMIIALALWYPSIYLSVDKNKFWKTLINHTAGGIITSIIWIYTGFFILSNSIDDTNYLSFLNDSLIWRFNIGLIFYAITVIFYYVAYYYKGYKEKARQESELKALVKDAELKKLKYQINPHFIFNSLNSISSLTISDADKAREMIIKLSNFMRRTLSKNENQMIALRDEISNSSLYMEIEKIRFGDGIEFIENISDDCKGIQIPSMILQPLFENAIKHGVYESMEKITIKLSCRKDEKYFVITLQNNFDPDGISRKGEGIGIQNIKSRLKLIYNQDNLITHDILNNIFTVNVYIPLT
jgi:two-component system LytT family sensor kinase